MKCNIIIAMNIGCDEVCKLLEKIENPKLAYKEEWDTFNDARKNRSLQHWEQEIKAFTQQREDAIKFLGDDKNGE